MFRCFAGTHQPYFATRVGLRSLTGMRQLQGGQVFIRLQLQINVVPAVKSLPDQPVHQVGVLLGGLRFGLFV